MFDCLIRALDFFILGQFFLKLSFSESFYSFVSISIDMSQTGNLAAVTNWSKMFVNHLKSACQVICYIACCKYHWTMNEVKAVNYWKITVLSSHCIPKADKCLKHNANSSHFLIVAFPATSWYNFRHGRLFRSVSDVYTLCQTKKPFNMSRDVSAVYRNFEVLYASKLIEQANKMHLRLRGITIFPGRDTWRQIMDVEKGQPWWYFDKNFFITWKR